MDPSTLIHYRDELADLMRERFGPKKDRPVRYLAAFCLTSATADLLTDTDFAAVLQAALRGERESRGPNRPVGWSFSEYFGLALQADLGEFDAVEGRREAWHIVRALRSILPGDLFSPFIRCAYDAWENTVEVVHRTPARV
ncbi:hypothetical protein ACIOHO_37070 [Streptomyces sp. NPDC087849]|uniref:hypothetical protein n=1 Tax=Streptomyces sp. NPDC087849 TaxID=3365808 RepID=UPI00382FB906